MSLCFRLQVHQAGGRVRGCQLPETDEPGGATLHNDFVQRVRERSVIISDHSLTGKQRSSGLHNSINLKVIVTAIRSTRDYPIHRIHSFNRKTTDCPLCHSPVLLLCLPRSSLSFYDIFHLIWYIISAHKNHIPLLYALCLFCEFDCEIFCAFE